MTDYLANLSPPQRRAVELMQLLIQLHGGSGLFDGSSRYVTLEARARLAAERSRNVAAWFDLLVRSMGWSIAAMTHDARILALTVPSADDPDVLAALAERTVSIIMIARQQARLARDPTRQAWGDPAEAAHEEEKPA